MKEGEADRPGLRRGGVVVTVFYTTRGRAVIRHDGRPRGRELRGGPRQSSGCESIRRSIRQIRMAGWQGKDSAVYGTPPGRLRAATGTGLLSSPGPIEWVGDVELSFGGGKPEAVLVWPVGWRPELKYRQCGAVNLWLCTSQASPPFSVGVFPSPWICPNKMEHWHWQIRQFLMHQTEGIHRPFRAWAGLACDSVQCAALSLPLRYMCTATTRLRCPVVLQRPRQHPDEPFQAVTA